MKLAIQQTRDGSHTLCNLELNQTYHSIHGAVYESIHVFIRAGLEFVLEKKKEVRILEIGFGTGLNALLTLQKVLERSAAGEPIHICYTSLEPYPVPLEVVHQLNYAQYFDDSALYQSLLGRLHQADWEQWKEIEPGFQLEKKQVTLDDFDSQRRRFDLIYFDPFPPTAQPYLWDKMALAKLAGTLEAGGVFTTYGAQGQFKRDLKEVGMEVQSLPGPPGKREMTRAVKLFTEVNN
jgi:tRNA U34 5-methylaminomethyl-2-thiouridine-forming methyltransferase MnmC